MNQTLPEPILKSLSHSRFKWRTAQGVAADANMDVTDVVRTLENSGEVIRASEPNKNGKAVYALRKTYQRDQSLLQRVASAFANTAG